MKTLKFDCPFCDCSVELPEENAKGEIHCPRCSRFFNPATFDGPVPEVREEKHTGQELAVKFEKRDQKDERSAIRQQAGIFTFVAIILAAIGAFFLFAALRACIVTEPCADDLIASACLFSIASGLYLIAQVVHIRANTHR